MILLLEAREFLFFSFFLRCLDFLCFSRFEGEIAVKSAFPDATIVRPAVMFGHEDWFLNWSVTLKKKKLFRICCSKNFPSSSL